MPDFQVTTAVTFPLAKRNQIARVKLSMGIEMEGKAMMNLQICGRSATAGRAGWMLLQMGALHRWPFR